MKSKTTFVGLVQMCNEPGKDTRKQMKVVSQQPPYKTEENYFLNKINKDGLGYFMLSLFLSDTSSQVPTKY